MRHLHADHRLRMVRRVQRMRTDHDVRHASKLRRELGVSTRRVFWRDGLSRLHNRRELSGIDVRHPRL
jgi:hypothetical protein